MSIKPSGFKVDKTYFDNCPIGKEFSGRYKGFRPTRDYYIGVCEVESISEKLEDGTIIFGSIDFILRKKDISFMEMFELGKELKNKKLTLIFKGFSQKGYPVFFHKFD